MRLLSLCLAAALMWGCQARPTKTTQVAEPVLGGDPREWAQAVARQKPVILDARSPLDYHASHVPSARNVQLSDLQETEGQDRGLVLKDREALARRLALWGVGPQSPVLILGEGRLGGGQEGRVAWILRGLGVQKIQTGLVAEFRPQNPRDESLRENVPPWSPQDNKRSLNSSEFAEALQNSQALIVDLRFEKEFQQEPLWKSIKGQALHLDWRSLYDESGRPQISRRAELQSVLGAPDRALIFVSEDGVTASAAAFALEEMGWSQIRVLDGGLRWFRQSARKN